jgi:hypothetical protein
LRQGNVLSEAFRQRNSRHRLPKSRRPNRRFFLCSFEDEPFIARSQNKAGGTVCTEEHRISPFVVDWAIAKHVRRNSMTNRLMISVAAAALIAGSGFAYAQGTDHASPSTEHAAPSSAAPMNHNNASEKGAARSEEKMQPPGGTNQRAQDNTKASPRDEKSAQENKMKGEEPRGTKAQNEEKGSAGKDMKAEGREDRNSTKAEGRENRNDNMKAGREDRNGNMNAESKSTTESRSQTTGQAGAGAKLTTEQRTKITTVIREQHVAPVTNVNFSISVGTRVPRDVSFHPLPAEVVTYYPEWRSYEFILVNEQIVVVDPRTFEIVAVIDA